MRRVISLAMMCARLAGGSDGSESVVAGWVGTRGGVAVSVWDRLNEWLSAAIVASLTWMSGIVSPGLPPHEAPPSQAVSGQFMIGWAQEVAEPPIEQVGEGTGDDVEALDEGALPVEDATVAQDGDVELLDQGAPPTTAGQPVDTVYVAPTTDIAPAADTATTYVSPEPAPTVATGPVLPEGFGTGRVHAVAGRSETPIGLAECHVGAVTGRAYVGLDCGEDEGDSFVGHAPSFESFPFVLEAEFPFEGDEAFLTDPNFPFGDDEELEVAASRDERSETDVFVSARGETRERDDEATDTAPVIETGGESSVAYAQRAREREPRVRIENRARRDGNDKKRTRSEANDGKTNAESRNDDGDSDQVTTEGNKKKKAKDKKGKKNKKDRAERQEKKKRHRDRR